MNFKKCDVCLNSIDNYLDFGEIMKRSDLTVHYFCLLLSTNLEQRGTDKAGFLGFQLNDVRSEIKKAKERICYYCKEAHASIKCKECPIYFHLKCGIENSCNFEFIGRFESSCHLHNKYLKIKMDKNYDPKFLCSICYSALGEFSASNHIMPQCCKKRWIHRKCLQLYAFTSGYYFFCVLCKNLEFRDNIKYQGIFVPDRDATWELDKATFSKLYQNYSKCDANPCHSKARTLSEKNSRLWKILLCNCCAASGIHAFCLGVNFQDFSGHYTCPTCINIFNKTIYGNDTFTCRTLIGSHLEIDRALERSINRNDTLYIKKHTSPQTKTIPNLTVAAEDKRVERNIVKSSYEVDPITNQKFLVKKKYNQTTKQMEIIKKIPYNPIINCFDDSDEELDEDLFEYCIIKYFENKISNNNHDGIDFRRLSSSSLQFNAGSSVESEKKND